MKETDTPRTDAEESTCQSLDDLQWGVAGWKLTRQLERELAEALEELKKANQYIATGRSWNAPDSLLAEIDTLKRELAEARGHLAFAGVGDYKADCFLGELTETGLLRKQRDTLVEVLSEIIHEEGGTRGLASSNPICVKARQALAAMEGGEA
jgi:hypothetical protein